jgi:hypothetical protein
MPARKEVMRYKNLLESAGVRLLDALVEVRRQVDVLGGSACRCMVTSWMVTWCYGDVVLYDAVVDNDVMNDDAVGDGMR